MAFPANSTGYNRVLPLYNIIAGHAFAFLAGGLLLTKLRPDTHVEWADIAV